MSIQNYENLCTFASLFDFFREKSNIFAYIRQILPVKFAKLKKFYYLCKRNWCAQHKSINYMKKFTLSFLLAALVCLPQSVSAKLIEDRLGEFKYGEAISHPYEDEVFMSFLIDNQQLGVVELLPTLVGTSKLNGHPLYRMGKIYCIGGGDVTIQAVKDNGDVYKISLFGRTDHYIGIGWHGGKGAKDAAADSLFVYHSSEVSGHGTPLPAFFVCLTAKVANKKFTRTWQELPMKDYYYESSNGDFAFVSEYWCNGDSLVINGSGESTISMRFPSGDFDTKDGRKLWIPEQKHSFRVKGKLNMNIDLSMFPNKEWTLIQGNGILTDFGIWPEGYLISTDPSNFGKELTVRLTDNSPKDVVELTTQMDGEFKKYSFASRECGLAAFEITMPETEEYFAGIDTLWINVDPYYVESYDGHLLGYDEEDYLVEELTIKEGKKALMPHLVEVGPGVWERFNPRRLAITSNGLARYIPDEGDGKLYGFAAGEDTVVYTYNIAKDGPFTYTKLPVHITPYLEPQTTINLTTNPLDNDNLALTAYYNAEKKAIELEDVLTDDDVEAAMNNYTCGTDEWKAALPSSLSFNLPKGKVTVNILCWTKAGYELRAKVRGREVEVIPSQTADVQTHTFTFNLTAPSAIVFYMVEVPNDAPARRAKADEEAVALITGINIDHEEIITAVEAVQPAATVSGLKKIFRNGQMLIIRDGKTYTMQGVELR